VSYSKARLSDVNASQTDDNGGLDYLTMLFPIGKKIGVSFGILPYSSVGYSFGVNKTEGGVSYQEYFSGSGNLSQIYGGIAYEMPIKGLSVGANVSYLFGRLKHDRSLPFSTTTIYTRTEYKKLSVSAAKFDIGVQYQLPLSNNKKVLTLGAVFTPQIKTSARASRREVLSSGDTLTYTSPTGTNAGLPLTIGGGFTLSNKRNLLFGADFTFQKWQDLDYPAEMNDNMTSSDRFNNRYRANAGVEYVVDPFDRNFWRKIKLRAGVNYSNSYLNVKNNLGESGGYKEYGATIGFGIPMARDVYTQRVSYLNLSFEYTTLRPELNNMVKEQYFGVSLNVNINDLWFMKNKFK